MRKYYLQAIQGNTAVPEFLKKDFGHSLDACMLKDNNGIYHSDGREIILDKYCDNDGWYVPGWEFADGKYLSTPYKIIACADGSSGGWHYVAFAQINRADGIVEIFCSKTKESVWDEVVGNIFSRLTFQKIASCETVRGLAFTPDCRHFIWMNSEGERPSLLSDYKKAPNVELKETENGVPYAVFNTVADSERSVIVCPGGPFVSVPDPRKPGTLIEYLMNNGIQVVVPFRRGMTGINPAWEHALRGNYGHYDVADTLDVISHYKRFSHHRKLIVYGASYGGFTAGLIAGKYPHIADRFIIHCAMLDLVNYPVESQGNPEFIMLEYGKTTEPDDYAQRVADISPASFLEQWDKPTLLVHSLDDATVSFRQSVRAYNKTRDISQLLLLPGPHSYDTPLKQELFKQILSFIME